MNGAEVMVLGSVFHKNVACGKIINGVHLYHIPLCYSTLTLTAFTIPN